MHQYQHGGKISRGQFRDNSQNGLKVFQHQLSGVRLNRGAGSSTQNEARQIPSTPRSLLSSQMDRCGVVE